jgi:hypothetical protein
MSDPCRNDTFLTPFRLILLIVPWKPARKSGEHESSISNWKDIVSETMTLYMCPPIENTRNLTGFFRIMEGNFRKHNRSYCIQLILDTEIVHQDFYIDFRCGYSDISGISC